MVAPLSVPRNELSFTFSRSSGPGGQNVNKLNTKATLRWNVAASSSLPDGVRERFVTRYANRLTNEGELVLTSQRYRDQARNVADCLAKLETMLAAVARPPRRRKKTRPSRASKERRLAEKKLRSDRKQSRRVADSGR
jgi:ribosome-associated protein